MQEYYIWSNEHLAYWKANRDGYTKFPDEAGLYSFEEANQICEEANKFLDNPKVPNEQMIHYSKVPTQRYWLDRQQ